MKPLYVKIDRDKKQALFSGPGTFEAKDQLKQLGKARWQPVDKAWLIGEFSLSDDELTTLFPQAEIEGADAKPKSEVKEIDFATTVEKPQTIDRTLKEVPENPLTDNSELPAGYSVSGLMKSFRNSLTQAYPGVIHVYGVLSSVKRSGERVFLNLRDHENPDQQLSCVIWAKEAKLTEELTKAGFKLEENLQVMFAVKVSLNEKRGYLSLVVSKIISEYTLAKLAAQRDITNKRLKKEGLFGKNKELALPFLPKKLLLLTSSGGTVIHDFRASLDEAEFAFDLKWLPVPVQGLEAKGRLISALKFARKQTNFDAVLLFRGGGSAADLQIFNEYEVARAICLAKIPVLVAVGHQEDLTSATDVANIGFGVPKDLGRFFRDRVEELREGYYGFLGEISELSDELVGNSLERVSELKDELSYSVNAMLSSNLSSLKSLSKLIPSQGQGLNKQAQLQLKGQSQRAVDRVKFTLQKKQQLLSTNQDQIANSSQQLLTKQREALGFLERHFSEASPQTQLKRGFTMVKHKGAEKYALSASELQKSQEIEITFHDKSVPAKIT